MQALACRLRCGSWKRRGWGKKDEENSSRKIYNIYITLSANITSYLIHKFVVWQWWSRWTGLLFGYCVTSTACLRAQVLRTINLSWGFLRTTRANTITEANVCHYSSSHHIFRQPEAQTTWSWTNSASLIGLLGLVPLCLVPNFR